MQVNDAQAGKKPNVLVTGSSGLIGTALIKQMAKRYQIIGFDNVGFPFPPPQAENIPVDLTDSESVARGVARIRYAYGNQLAAVIHLAAYYDFSGDPSPLYEELTVGGTQRLLHALRDFEIERFIFSSTMLIHQPTQPGQPIDESWPLTGKWDYPQSKIETEQLIHRERGKIPVALLRIAGVYTDMGDSIPIVQQIRRIYENHFTSHLYPGDLTHGQSFVHLDDTVDAIVRTVEQRRHLPEEVAILIGEPETLSYGQLQQMLGQLIHGEPDWSTEHIPAEMAKIGAWTQSKIPGMDEPFIKPWMVDLADDHYELDISRARNLLGWEPKHRLVETVPKMVAALRSDPRGWYEHNELEPPASLPDLPPPSDPSDGNGSMGQRGVTRISMSPQNKSADGNSAQSKAHSKPQPKTQSEAKSKTRAETEKSHNSSEQNGMSEEMRHSQQVRHHKQTLWVYWAIILLGGWMIASAITFGYQNGGVEVAGDRWLPWALETRQRLMFWSDIFSGLLLIAFGWLSLNPFRPKALWAACLVGVWMNFAPLIFWSPTAWGYANNTLVGALVVALTVLIPGMPWMLMMMKQGPQVPKGWSYNPSSWPQRWIMIATGIAGWFVSRYLGAYQLGYIPHVWEPFFGEGSVRVLNSNVSHLWPVSDGGLGAFTYTFEALMGFMGSPARWRTMPWMVLLFGILVIPLGLTHVLLIMSQPVLVGHWCTFCLLAAAIMLPMIPLEIDEVIAMCQFMVQSKREGKPFWRTFWRGGSAKGEGADQRSPALSDAPSAVIPAMFWGMSIPWTLGITTLLGIWLLITPALWGDTARMADSDHLVGALVITVSVLAMGEVVRALRYLNVLLGLWVALSPFVVTGATTIGLWNAVGVGLLIVLLSIPRGIVREEYGLWQKYVV